MEIIILSVIIVLLEFLLGGMIAHTIITLSKNLIKKQNENQFYKTAHGASD